uniref:Uncharacterized protein n=1 Tax=Anguilla anguilla TaxID=7936 RepID=A0A0E9TMX8_ANGAN
MSVLIHFSMNVKTYRPSLHLCYSVKQGGISIGQFGQATLVII